jgi:outer membrane lipoprotein SlyB
LEFFMQRLMAGTLLVGLTLVAACATRVGPNEFSSGEIGSVARVEEGTLVGARYVNITGVVPFGLKPFTGSATPSPNSRKVSNRRMGITYVVRLDRTGELLSVTQGDDFALGTGARVFVEYADRVRVIPNATPAPR